MSGNSESRVCVTVGLTEGMHMRPWSLLAKAASAYASEISVCKGEQSANAKMPLELMTLVAEHGEELSLVARGEDAQAAVDHLGSLFASNFAIEDS